MPAYGATVFFCIVAITRLIAYAIDDDKRWPRFRNLALFAVFLVLAIAAGWWLLAGGGVQVLIHDFGVSTPLPGHCPGK